MKFGGELFLMEVTGVRFIHKLTLGLIGQSKNHRPEVSLTAPRILYELGFSRESK